MSDPRNPIIVLEGIDGAGTTTQSKRLAETLETNGHPAYWTCQPSSGEIGVVLRQHLSGSVDNPHLLSLLFAADRTHQWQEEIEPARARAAVVCDRWWHSSLAYQGGDGLMQWVETLNQHLPAPTLTIFLRVSPEEALRRRQADNRKEELFDALATQTKIAERYESIVANSRGTIEVVDGHQSPDAIAAQILAMVTPRCTLVP